MWGIGLGFWLPKLARLLCVGNPFALKHKLYTTLLKPLEDEEFSTRIFFLKNN